MTVFCVCAFLTIAITLLRRPAELGGSTITKYMTATFFVALWFVYVVLSTFATYKLIPTF